MAIVFLCLFCVLIGEYVLLLGSV